MYRTTFAVLVEQDPAGDGEPAGVHPLQHQLAGLGVEPGHPVHLLRHVAVHVQHRALGVERHVPGLLQVAGLVHPELLAGVVREHVRERDGAARPGRLGGDHPLGGGRRGRGGQQGGRQAPDEER
jgi:hypothetical protein